MQEHSLLWPGELPSNPVKRRVQVVLGHCFAALLPRRAARIRAGSLPLSPGWVDRQMLCAWVDRCERSGQLAALAPLHRWLWRHPGAAGHHAATRDRFERWWAQGHQAIVPGAQQALAAAGWQPDRIVEIGCGTGEGICKLRAAWPEVPHWVGLDLSAAQIDDNVRRLPGVDWVCADARDWIANHPAPRTLYITIGGVLEYLAEAELAALLTDMRRQGPAAVACVEPIAPDHDLDRETASRPYSSERSYGHNYLHHLRAAGFEVAWHAEQTIGSRWCLVAGVAP